MTKLAYPIFIILLIILLISSCSPTKDKHQALNDYVNTVVKDTFQEIIIIKNKINSNQTIDIFKFGTIYGETKLDTILYNERDWRKMEKKYAVNYQAGKNLWFTTDFWTKENFNHKRIIFEDSFVGKADAFQEKYDYKPSIDIYSFSEPIHYKNKRVVVFTVHKTATSFIGLGHTHIIIMKKKGGKWIVTHTGLPDWHN
ncbi:hypothetical protein [Flavobacterium sp. HJJ]|uniref:hypothetical protein n=1 Tax=Flavobacterium sp. HJJ TaxID=2783792 RepID=UPI00188D1141|nr:hypothetical protein [Flavobacterium sp. HJJ]MBF4473752.1 hypothetical protein [Flavobacterium sp. HJJ]